jgi:hypothetical protein
MAIAYPDIIGDFLTTTERFGASGIQYAAYFEPARISPGEMANLYLFLQSTVNVPVKVQFQVTPPTSGGFFRAKKSLLELMHTTIALELGPAEAGLLTVPVTTTEHTRNGQLALTIVPKTATQGRGKRIRPQQSKTKLDQNLIDSPVGLDLVSSLGATYTEKSVKKAEFPLTVDGTPKVLARAPKLNYRYDKIWDETNLEHFNSAIQELNARQVKIRNEFEVEKLYVNLYAESVARFADCGLPLRIGEAITMAKILTYSSQYFLSSPKRANGLLVPIWERAYREGADTTDSLSVLRTVGFNHTVRLAIAVSFGLISKGVGKQYWSLEERQAVANHIADTVDSGQPMDLDFLYLPLLIAGTRIADKVRMRDEDPKHSLALMHAARTKRNMLFADDDMAKADKIYNRILKKAFAT